MKNSVTLYILDNFMHYNLNKLDTINLTYLYKHFIKHSILIIVRYLNFSK